MMHRAALFMLGVIILSGLWLFAYAYGRGPARNGRPVEAFVPPGSSFVRVYETLVEAGAVHPDRRFPLLARILGVTRTVKAGEYRFAAGTTPLAVLRVLERGEVVSTPVTIPEGYTLVEIAALLELRGITSGDRFLAVARDIGFVSRLGYGGGSLEGYLFPDTYHFVRDLDPASVAKAMVRRLETVLDDIGYDREADTPLALHELLTLASIVEKETALPSERPVVARVFLNRLEKGMRLQTDPTVIYGIENFNGNLTRRDLRTFTPYNTYMIDGLPPGPIASPGRAAIEAVLDPDPGDYLYFVSRNDGSHIFSKTLAEHNRAVNTYQKSK